MHQILTIALLSYHAVVAAPPITTSSSLNSCTVFCSGDLLRTFQTFYIFGNDSKAFVDSPLKVDPNVVVTAFNALPRPLTKPILELFAEKYFDPVGSDLIPWTPSDWSPSPPLLNHSIIAQNITLRNFTLALNNFWLDLGRQPTVDVFENPQRHTLLPTAHPLIVPGGRFRESYYWDSYWIVKGLLYSGMLTTANGIVDNFVDFIHQFGFVPNGGRSYYLTRSQPPLLSEMVRVLEEDIDTCNDARLLAVKKEHTFWTQHRTWRSVTGAAATGEGDQAWKSGATLPQTCNVSVAMSLLNYYDANTTLPRPESFREDALLAEEAARQGLNQSQLLRNIAAAAESGWDFSSRWFADHATLLTARTTSIIPVELNVVMARMEFNICNMSNSSNSLQGMQYCDRARRRWDIIENCMWNETTSRWNDLVVSSFEQKVLSEEEEKEEKIEEEEFVVSQVVGTTSVANWIPLWGSYLLSTLTPLTPMTPVRARASRVGRAALSLRDESGLYLEAGLSTTNMHTGQQWDYPNAWAPLQDFIIDGLRNSAKGMAGVSKEEAKMMSSFAKELSTRWLETNVKAWMNSGYMYEKYDAVEMGKGGGGGEYVPQIGFGWSNGVVFELLHSLKD